MRPGFMKSFHTLSVCFVIIPLMGPIPRLMQLCHTYSLNNTTGMDSVLFWLWVYPASSWSNSKIDAVTFVTPVDFTTRQVWTLFCFGCGSTQLLVGPIPRLIQLLLSLLLTLQHDRCWLCFIITMAGQIWRGNGDCYNPPKPNTILFGNPQSIIFGLIIVLTQALLSHVVRRNEWPV